MKIIDIMAIEIAKNYIKTDKLYANYFTCILYLQSVTLYYSNKLCVL